MVIRPWLTFAVNFSLLAPALAVMPFARFVLELEKTSPGGKATVIVLSAAACLATTSVNESFSLPFATPERDGCDNDEEVWPASAVPRDDSGGRLTGTLVRGEVGSNVTSRPAVSTAVHWLTAGQAT